MSCVNIIDREKNYFVFACDTTDTAFGPLMYVPEEHDIDEVAESFRESLGKDPRRFEDSELCKLWNEFYLKEGL